MVRTRRAQQSQLDTVRLDRIWCALGCHHRRAADLRSRPAPGLVRLEGNHALRICGRTCVLDLRCALPDRRATLPQPAAAARPQLLGRDADRVRHGYAELHEPSAVSEPAA